MQPIFAFSAWAISWTAHVVVFSPLYLITGTVLVIARKLDL